MTRTAWALSAVYLVAIVAANLLIATYGPSAAVWVAFLFVGLDLTVRDALHSEWAAEGRAELVYRMFTLIVLGGVLSYRVNEGAGIIAVASTAAFVAAAIGDGIAYELLRRRRWLERVNGSNLVGAAIDSLVFPTIAFGALLPLVVVGQFAAKVLGGLVWSLALRPTLRLVRRVP